MKQEKSGGIPDSDRFVQVNVAAQSLSVLLFSKTSLLRDRFARPLAVSCVHRGEAASRWGIHDRIRTRVGSEEGRYAFAFADALPVSPFRGCWERARGFGNDISPIVLLCLRC